MGNICDTDIHIKAKEAIVTNQFKLFETIIDDPQHDIDFFKLFDVAGVAYKQDLISMILCTTDAVALPSQSRINLLAKIKMKLDHPGERSSNNNKTSRQKEPQLNQQLYSHSYIRHAAKFHPTDVLLFNFVLDNFFFERRGDNDYAASSSTSERLLCLLAAQPESIEMLRLFISSGKMSSDVFNTNNDDDDKSGEEGPRRSFLASILKKKAPLQIACEHLNVDAAREFCVAGIGGSNYFDCVEALFKHSATTSGPQNDEKATNIFLTLVAQPGFDKKEILQGTKHKMTNFLQRFVHSFEIMMPSDNTLVLSARCNDWTQLADCLISNGAPDFPEGGVRSLKLERACSLTGEYKSIEMKSSTRATYLVSEAFSSKNTRYKWLIDINHKDERGRTLLDWAKANGLKEAADILVANGAV